MPAIKHYKPTTPGRRGASVVNYKEALSGDKPYKKLLVRKKNPAGRSKGRISVRHRGGGARMMLRVLDLKRNFPLGFKVETIEYDPNRTAFICLVSCLKTGDKKYILHSKNMVVGNKYQENGDIVDGNLVELSSVPVGTFVSQVELQPNKGAAIVRSAGNYAIVTAREEKYVTLKLPSGEIRRFLGTCRCVVNRVGNEVKSLVRLGKAGRVRHKGFRPTVRGKVMNPVDHPHGGGEARNSIGMKYPKTPWGKHAMGVRTRLKKKASNSLIVVNRRGKKK
jgi:large subunit ribosomal protein L2